MSRNLRNKELLPAKEEYLSRRSKLKHPKGAFAPDGTWHPSDQEWQPCCMKIKSPKYDYPFSYLYHCRSMEHVANLYGVGYNDLRRFVRAVYKTDAKRGSEYYIPVALVDGEYRAIEDGRVFRLGIPVYNPRPREGSKNGIYVYRSAGEAFMIKTPKDSCYSESPRAVLVVSASSPYHRSVSARVGKPIAFGHILPLREAEVTMEEASQVADAFRNNVPRKGIVT